GGWLRRRGAGAGRGRPDRGLRRAYGVGPLRDTAADPDGAAGRRDGALAAGAGPHRAPHDATHVAPARVAARLPVAAGGAVGDLPDGAAPLPGRVGPGRGRPRLA